MQTTLIILKPDAIHRRLIGPIITRFENKGLRIIGMKMMKVTRALAEQHYAEHKGKPFYDDLIAFITSSPVLALAVRGNDAVAVCRKLIGKTKGTEAEPGTIRGDFGLSGAFNLVHGSDSETSAARELELWFNTNELNDYVPVTEHWIYQNGE